MRAPLVSALAGVVFAFAQPLIAQTLGCVGGGAGGPVPTTGSGGGGTFPSELPSFPGVFALNVPALPPGANVVSEVKVLGITHTAAGELHFVLTSPAGLSYNVVLLRGGACSFAGDYVFVPGCASVPVNPWSCSILLPQGAYEQSFGLWPDGGNGIFNASLYTIPAEVGVWTLTVYDWGTGDIGNVNSWELCFGAAPIPSSNAPAGAPTPTTPQDGDTLLGPTIGLGWFADPCATSYEVEVDGVIAGSSTSASFGYASTAGAHNWRVRSRNSVGVGPWSVVLTFTDAGVPPPPCAGAQLTTLFAKNNGVSSGGILYFDLEVLSPSGILVSEIDVNTSAGVGAPLTVGVWLKAGTHVGFATTPSAWSLVANGTGFAAGVNRRSLIDVADFQLPQGLHGVGVILTGGAQAHTSVVATQTVYSNGQITLTAGQSQFTPFLSTPFSSRVWNGALRYDCIPAPASYCTAGVTSGGCSATISASASPSAMLASACQIDVTNVEGQRQGLIFYGVDNSGFSPLPWDSASTSYLCVKPPVQRAAAMNSGGAAGQCDGALALDWNALQSANPLALGSPFMVGDKVYVQGWFRDPPAPRATNLSNAIELTVGP